MNEFLQLLGAVAAVAGALFMLLSALGMVRMPDLFIRMSMSTKAATLGVGLIMLGVALHFQESSISTRAVAATLFMLLTGPVAAHRIARAAYFSSCTLWEYTRLDELQGRYDTETHVLASGPELENPAPGKTRG